jgi:hypothetical protein
VKLKLDSDIPETGRKIRSVLNPVEYTRLDRLVDVMFTTATDVTPLAQVEPEFAVDPEITSEASAKLENRVSPATTGTWVFTDPLLLENKRRALTEALSGKLHEPLIKKSRALFWSADHAKRIVCTVSKRYLKRASYPYWYAYHPRWNDFLLQGDEGYLVLGCMDLLSAFAVPRDVVQEALPKLNTTTTENGTYWHIHIVQSANGDYEMLAPKGGLGNVSLARFEVALSEKASSEP